MVKTGLQELGHHGILIRKRRPEARARLQHPYFDAARPYRQQLGYCKCFEKIGNK